MNSIYIYILQSTINPRFHVIYSLDLGQQPRYIGSILYSNAKQQYIGYTVFGSPLELDIVSSSLPRVINKLKKLCKSPYIFIEVEEAKKLSLLF